MSDNFPVMGQPRKGFKREFVELDPEWENIILDLAQAGKSMTWWCINLGIDPDTFRRFARDIERFDEVWKMALLLQRAWWEDQGQRMVETGKGNFGVYQLTMTNLFGYRGQTKVINQIGDGKPHYTGEFTDAEEDDDDRELSKEELLAELEKRGLPTEMFRKQHTPDEVLDAQFEEM